MRILIIAAAALAWSACGDGSSITVFDGGFRVDAESDSDSVSSLDDATAACSLLDENSCGEGGRCVPSLVSFAECVDAGPLPRGAACGDDGLDRCAAGLLCVRLDTESTSQCRALCNPVEDEPCAGEDVCAGPGWLTSRFVGVCVTP